MSTLKVTNIQATGETASRAVSGVAAAWVNFNGTGTIAARDSENVSSLVDRATGRYDFNLTNAMTSSSNYVVTGNAQNVPGTNFSWKLTPFDNTDFSASHFPVTTTDGSDTRGDAGYVLAQVQGDLA